MKDLSTYLYNCSHCKFRSCFPPDNDSQTEWEKFPSVVSFRSDGVIRGKGKICYLDGSLPKPAPTDSSYLAWEIQNSMVMAWLIHSMDDSIGDTFLFYATTKEIWAAVTLAYLDLQDSSASVRVE